MGRHKASADGNDHSPLPLMIYDITTDALRPATQADIDSLSAFVQRLMYAAALAPLDSLPAKPMNFRLRVYPNRFRDDSVFVAEDMPLTPYANLRDLRGQPIYPSVPSNTTRYIGSGLDPIFAHELVRRWNAFVDTPVKSE